MSAKLDKIVKIYKSLSQIPALHEARIQSPNVVHSVWTQRNLEKGSNTKFSKTILLNNLEGVRIEDSLPPVDVTTELLTCVSPSRKLKAVLRGNDSKQLLEIWNNTGLYRIVDLEALDLHGNVYADAEFAAFEFSPDETKLLYVAEKKAPKSEPFYKRKKAEETKEGGDAKPIPKGQEYLFEQDWGEQLVGSKKSVLAQYDVETDSVSLLEGIPENVCVAQPKYSPDGKCVVGIAYFTEPRKLGLIYCSNRPSTVFQLSFDGNYVELPLQDKSVKAPIFTPDGKSLVWLERQAGGPHMTCMSLMRADAPLTKDSETKTVVDVVNSKITIANNKLFYGLYNTGFHKRPWAGNNKLFLNTVHKYVVKSYVVDIDSGAITELEYEKGSQYVLDVKDNLILAVRRDFLLPDRLVVGKLPEQLTGTNIEWTQITDAIEVPELLETVSEYFDLVAQEGGSFSEFNAIYLGPKSGGDKSVPLIVLPHGGPHSVFANFFMLQVAMFLATGYAVVLINYRGSIGCGKDSVEFLLGKVGTSDVQDCCQAVDAVVKKCPWINDEQLALCGGSHGGFLVAHLSGQYPDKFKCVVARNPVIDIASMSVSTDIPDWSYVELGREYTQKGEIVNDVLLKMREASPIVHAHKVKAPTLLQIGSKDLRVSQYQGMEYYYRLKANGVTTRMSLYDDNHPLGKVPNEMDNVINTLLWIEEHMGTK